jgi:hypothetical protein
LLVPLRFPDFTCTTSTVDGKNTRMW